MKVHTIVQLSDLHLSLGTEQNAIFEALERVLREQLAGAGRNADLLLITGDVFDSALMPRDAATRAFAEWHAQFVRALGGDVPTVIIPGNHDRRRRGFVGPHDKRIFEKLAQVMGQRAFVHGGDNGSLAAVVPRSYHGLPASIIAYDSTFLPRGLLSAGGVIRQEDLLHAAALLAREASTDPVLFLLHHHLVPTPLTDFGAIDFGSPRSVLGWTMRKLLPRLIAHADREELTMTALGAGTAISTLHELGRAVLVLHGHKHYATARMLRGMIETQGDVLIVSAGSCGIAERWTPASSRDGARLWPSFNLLELEGNALRVGCLSFGYKGRSAARSTRRELVRAKHTATEWHVTPVPLEPAKPVGPHLARNHRTCRLTPSQNHEGRWDYECTRLLEANGKGPRRYVELIQGPPGSRLVIDGKRRSRRQTPTRVELGIGSTTTYRVEGGLFRTVRHRGPLIADDAPPYEWVGLMNRYACDDVALRLDGLGDRANLAFASTTDLGTGIEQPLKLTRGDGDSLTARVVGCAPRTLLRVYFELSQS